MTPGGNRTHGRGWGFDPRPLVGLLMIAAIIGVIALAVGLFRGSFTSSVPVTVYTQRSGLVMNADAKVKLRGVQVGKVARIDALPGGKAALQLALDPAQRRYIPDNVNINISSSTVFGAKYVELVTPEQPNVARIRAGQQFEGQRVTVEINTVFKRLSDLLDRIDPPKLNQTLGAISKAFNGRGDKIGQTFADLDTLLTRLEPSFTSLSQNLEMLPPVAGAYADSAADLLAAADNAAAVGETVVDVRDDLDAALMGTIGLSDIGNEVIGDNRRALTDLFRLLVPTTELLDRYHESLNCTLTGLIPFTQVPPQPESAVLVNVGFEWAAERYRYPGNLPKVGAKGGPFCDEVGMPFLQPNEVPDFVVTDVGANPGQYGNQGILINSDGLKQMLFGPLDGPPRNSTQIGMPG